MSVSNPWMTQKSQRLGTVSDPHRNKSAPPSSGVFYMRYCIAPSIARRKSPERPKPQHGGLFDGISPIASHPTCRLK